MQILQEVRESLIDPNIQKDGLCIRERYDIIVSDKADVSNVTMVRLKDGWDAVERGEFPEQCETKIRDVLRVEKRGRVEAERRGP